MKSPKIVFALLCLILINFVQYSSTTYSSSTAMDPNPPTNHPWPMFHGNPRHTGLSPYGENIDKPVLKWKFKTDGEIYSSPAIGSDGTIYVGSNDGYLYAINPDGTLKWKFETDDEVCSSPAIGSDGTIYVCSSKIVFPSPYRDYLYAINPDGTLKWKFETDDDMAEFSSPAIGSDGTIYVGSIDGYLYAINPDGTLKWKFETGYRGTWTSTSPAIGSDGTVYYVGSKDFLYAINSDGTLKWKFSIYYTEYSSPAIDSDGTIYVGSNDGYLYAIGKSRGKTPDVNASCIILVIALVILLKRVKTKN